jgi:DNA-directed RNA polymerase specialized sigma24 family protein
MVRPVNRLHRPFADDHIRTEKASQGDTALFVRVVRRQPAALAEIFERYGGDVHAEASRSAGPERAAAVVHQVFDELWHTPDLYDATSGDLLPHLLCRTRIWGRAGHDSNGHKRPVGVDGATRTVSALAQLPSHQRDAITLARRPGFTYREVAAVLSRSETTVRRDIREGLTRLHQQMTSPPHDN